MKKNHIFTAFFLTFTILNTFGQSYSGGSGTETDPFKIANKADLQYLSENSSEWGYYFEQTANITFVAADFESTGAFYNNGAGFSPIGTDGNVGTPFTGNYNGNGHIIDGLFIDSEISGIGLFGYIMVATITDLGITNANITGNAHGIGALIGGTWLDDMAYSTVTNCYSTGTITGKNLTTVGASNSVGGLIGFSRVNVTNSYSTATVSGNESVGGLIGTNDGTISNSYATGAVTGTSYVGGLTGLNRYIVTACYASGAVVGTSMTIGGLAGQNYFATITDCYATGTVEGSDSVGGLVGAAVGSMPITNGYALGAVTGVSNVGALLGNNVLSTLSGGVWNTETSGQTQGVGSDSAATGAEGKSTTEMKDQSTYTNLGWDFTNIWNIACSYPTLQWENRGIDVTTTVDGATITANANDAGITYQWLDSNNAAISGATGQSYTATANGNYKVTVTQDGCSKTSDAVAITTLSVKNETELFTAILYPNPTRNNVTLSLPKTENITVTVYNVLGRVVYRIITTNKEIELPIQGQSGMYFVKVTTATTSKTWRVVKQ
ncbi:MAG: GLUG motif-containing protein [Flavobacteriaceae bacterium]